MKLFNKTQQKIVASKIIVADDFFSRLKGLLGTDSLPKKQALMIIPCSSVHTFGMRYAIDVLFIDKNGCIMKIVSHMEPKKLTWCKGSACAVELAAGSAARANAQIGNEIIILSAD